MGWTHPHVGLSELVDQTGAFLDILIMASGYKSDGSAAVWDAQALRKALGWAFYFEQVMQSLPTGKEGKASALAFDLALDALLGAVPLPPNPCNSLLESNIHWDSRASLSITHEGVPKLSFSMLANARSVILQLLVQALPIRNAWMAAKVVESDEDQSGDLWEAVINAMSERCMAFGSVRQLQRALDNAVGSSRLCAVNERKAEIWNCQLSSSSGNPGLNCPSDQDWAKQGLQYVTSAETIHKLSGASLIFRGSSAEWTQVLDSLQRRAPPNRMCGVKTEIAELCCLYLASSLWNDLPKRLFHATCNSANGQTVASTACYRDCWMGKTSAHVDACQQLERDEVETYLQDLVKSGADWWGLPPILVAAALASSPALKKYVQLLQKRIDKADGIICFLDRSCQHCALESDSQERAWCSLILLDKKCDTELARQLYDIL